jgi:hypothetical protein
LLAFVAPALVSETEPTRGEGSMGQTYQQRVDTVTAALAAQNIDPGPGRTLRDVAVQVLRSLDSIPEIVR